MGNSHPNIAPYSVYKSKDNEYIVIGVATDAQFEKLSQIIDPALWEDTRYKSNKLRCENRDTLNAHIQEKLQENWTKADLIKEMTKVSIPFSEILSVKQLLEDPEVSKMNLTQSVASDKYQGELKFPKPPVHFSKSSSPVLTEPPLLGEHTDSILRDLLGYSQNQIADLRCKHII